ncbi:MAG: polysaccharide lyase family 8 super-sandwich domain-containing protein [Rikenellaceae bacterium]
MRKALTLLLLSTLFMGNIQAQTIEKLISNLNEITLENGAADDAMAEEFIDISIEGRFNDVMIIELYTATILPDEKAQKLIDEFTPEHNWNDINYGDTRRGPWEPSVHLARIFVLSKVYFNKESSLYQDEKLFTVIMQAIDHWHAHRDIYVCNNWWYNDILIPRHLGPMYLLFWDKFSDEQKEIAIEIMNQSQFAGTGQNKVWVAGNVLMRGLLLGDIELVEQARDQIVEEAYLSLGEGLQYDSSFHQHGEQMQFGNYGLAYINSQVYWARVFRDSRLSVPQYKVRMLSDYILKGIQWTVWRGAMDPSAAGRQVFEDSQRGKGYSLSLSVKNMRETDSRNVEKYDNFLERNIFNQKMDNNLIGTSHFWHSDYFVKRSSDWYASVRMNSDRILGFEMTNRENLQGIYASDGALVVWVDGDEYENIYPIWDWKRLPGVTCFENGEKIPYTDPKTPINRSDFVGGVSQGDNGVAVMHIENSYIELRKANFFIDNLIVSLGADINIDNDYPATTTLNQRLLRKGSPITMGAKNGRRRVLNGESDERTLSWLHHDKVGYYLPEPTLIELSQQSRTEPWRRIADFFEADKVGSGEVFTASIKHPTRLSGGSYSYITLPNRTAAQVAAFASAPSVDIIANSAEIQAVATKDESTVGVVFYKAGSLKLNSGLEISASEPIVMMLEKSQEGYYVSVADATQKLDSVIISLSGKSQQVELPTQSGYRGSVANFEMK